MYTLPYLVTGSPKNRQPTHPDRQPTCLPDNPPTHPNQHIVYKYYIPCMGDSRKYHPEEFDYQPRRSRGR